MTIGFIDAPAIRHAETYRDDTMQRIALRELGDASRWVDLVVLNGLRPPYLVDDAADLDTGLILRGDLIQVPALQGLEAENVSEVEVFGADVDLAGGYIKASGGDIVLVSGRPNFVQALTHRVVNERADLAFHPTYGCLVRTLLGASAGPTQAQLAGFFARDALRDDPRVELVSRVDAVVSGDVLEVTATVVPVSGAPESIKVLV